MARTPEVPRQEVKKLKKDILPFREWAVDPVLETDLARRLAFRNPGVVRESTHILRTGGLHNYYIDIDLLLNDPTESKLVLTWYTATIRKIHGENPHQPLQFLAFIDRASGGTVGALQLASAISIDVYIPYVVIRLGKDIPSEQIKTRTSHNPDVPVDTKFVGYNFAVVTDHCTSGREVIKAVEAIEKTGGKVTHLLTYSIIYPEFRWKEIRDDKGIDVHFFLKAPDDLYNIYLPFKIKQLGNTDE